MQIKFQYAYDPAFSFLVHADAVIAVEGMNRSMAVMHDSAVGFESEQYIADEFSLIVVSSREQERCYVVKMSPAEVQARLNGDGEAGVLDSFYGWAERMLPGRYRWPVKDPKTDSENAQNQRPHLPSKG